MVVKDPNRPKRPSSSFMFFANKTRPTLRAKRPDLPITDVARELGVMWSKQDESARAPFVTLANADRERYRAQMENYVPPAASSDDVAVYKRSTKTKTKAKAKAKAKAKKDKASKKKKTATRRKKGKKGAKDPNKPKRGMSSFMHFANAKRASVRAANPDLKITEIGKLLGEQWRTMPEEKKAKYVTRATADNERYRKEMKSYKPPVSSSSSEAESSLSSDSDSSSDSSDSSSSD